MVGELSQCSESAAEDLAEHLRVVAELQHDMAVEQTRRGKHR